MKKIYSILVICVAMSIAAYSQVKTPQASPSSTLSQKVGLTDVTVEYSRPSAKGRAIFGSLVPYNKMWRTGANKNTMVTFSDNVMIAGSELKAGTYAIFVTPTKKNWKVDLYADTENWGTPKEWDESKVVASTTVDTKSLKDNVETFTISIDNLKDGGADISFAWENTKAMVSFTVPTDDMVMASIEKTMNGPSSNDYYAAGRYYKDSGKDYAKALEYINKSIEMRGEEKFWMVRQKALTLAKLGRTDEAIKAAEKSMMLAKEAGNDDYVRNNEQSIAEWKSMKK